MEDLYSRKNQISVIRVKSPKIVMDHLPRYISPPIHSNTNELHKVRKTAISSHMPLSETPSKSKTPTFNHPKTPKLVPDQIKQESISVKVKTKKLNKTFYRMLTPVKRPLQIHDNITINGKLAPISAKKRKSI